MTERLCGTGLLRLGERLAGVLVCGTDVPPVHASTILRPTSTPRKQVPIGLSFRWPNERFHFLYVPSQFRLPILQIYSSAFLICPTIMYQMGLQTTHHMPIQRFPEDLDMPPL